MRSHLQIQFSSVCVRPDCLRIALDTRIMIRRTPAGANRVYTGDDHSEESSVAGRPRLVMASPAVCCYARCVARQSSVRRTMSKDAHARRSGEAPEPLYDTNVPTPTHAERARTLVAQASTGTLCSLAIEPEGYPYGSFVTVAFDSGNPVFLISQLAEHTRNLTRDPRASLLIAESRCADPLANGRVTILGRCTPSDDDAGSARLAFLA